MKRVLSNLWLSICIAGAFIPARAQVAPPGRVAFWRELEILCDFHAPRQEILHRRHSHGARESVRRPLITALAFHDFIVNQGLLPFDLLEQAVMSEFGPARTESTMSRAP